MPARGRLARCRKGPPRPLSQGAASPVVARGRLARCRKGPPRPLSQGAASPVVQSSRILVPAGCGYRKGCRIQGCPRLVLRTGGLHLSLLQGDVVNLTRTSSSGSKPAEMLSALTIHSFVCLTKTADADCRCVDFQHVDS